MKSTTIRMTVSFLLLNVLILATGCGGEGGSGSSGDTLSFAIVRGSDCTIVKMPKTLEVDSQGGSGGDTLSLLMISTAEGKKMVTQANLK